MIQKRNDKINFPLVSVIVPVYNVEKFLKDCLDSIVNQTYRELEIIIIDDGSPDRCPSICDDYASVDSRVHVIHQNNSGLSEARNSGIKAAKGKYLLFVDSDDMLVNEQAIEELVLFLLKTDSLITYCSGAFRLDENGIEKKKMPFSDDNLLLTPDELLYFVRQNKYYLASWTFAIRRDFFINHSLFFFPGIYYEDIEWFPRLLLAEPDLKVNVFEKPYYLYRNNSNSITHSFTQINYDSYKKVLELYKLQMLQHPQSFFIKAMFNSTLYSMFLFFEKSCLSNSGLFKDNIQSIKALFKQNYNILTPRNKILFLFILFCPKLFYLLRNFIKRIKEPRL